MKRVIQKNLVSALLVLFTLTGYAHDGDEKSKITNVTFENVKNGATLTIKDLNGIILYRETIKQDGIYSKGFDLTALPDGSYFFELEKDVEIKVIPFKVNSNEVRFDKEQQSVINKPVVIDKNDHITVSKLALDEKPMEVKIYYENGDLIYSELLNNGQRLERIYDFSTSVKGSYQIIMKTEGREFVKNFKI
ncbi:MAG: hypothetical protein KDC69_02495 [Flavobacteriaceae bacterium]|nr:hypothetical protein [Flavobacteriaceae bacterium]MCB0474512.1 hypothetical protein [Flavobacteriaceae bacterium]